MILELNFVGALMRRCVGVFKNNIKNLRVLCVSIGFRVSGYDFRVRKTAKNISVYPCESVANFRGGNGF